MYADIATARASFKNGRWKGIKEMLEGKWGGDWRKEGLIKLNE